MKHDEQIQKLAKNFKELESKIQEDWFVKVENKEKREQRRAEEKERKEKRKEAELKEKRRKG